MSRHLIVVEEGKHSVASIPDDLLLLDTLAEIGAHGQKIVYMCEPKQEAEIQSIFGKPRVLAMLETPVRCTATVVALRVAVVRQRGACFKALYKRQNILTKQHTKQTVAENSHAKKKPKSLSSLHIKDDVN
eukprot:6203566-Pleurochrysis_carterae.AAC.4